MLVLSIQLPLRRFAFSPVTHNYLEISYSCLVGGSAAPLGRNVFTWSHNGAIIDLLSPENVVVPGLGPLTSCFDLRMYRLDDPLNGNFPIATKAELHYIASSLPSDSSD